MIGKDASTTRRNFPIAIRSKIERDRDDYGLVQDMERQHKFI